MQRRSARPRVSARGLLVLVLLAGVLGMHSLAAMGMPAAGTSSVAMAGMSSETHHGDQGGAPAQEHSVLHECLAVLGVAAALLVLALLAVRGPAAAPLLRHRSPSRRPVGRAPPPRPPSLAQLSLLQV